MSSFNQELDELKMQILEVATQQFCEKGYANTRMDDIAQVMGITKTPLYYHFKNKPGLFDAAYRKSINELYENDLMIFTKSGNLYDKLYEAFVACAVSFDQLRIGEMSQIIIREREELQKTFEYMEETDEMFYKFKTAAMRTAQIAGEIKEDVDIDEFYALLNACYNGILSYTSDAARISKINQNDKEKMVKNMIKKMLLALKPMYFNDNFK